MMYLTHFLVQGESEGTHRTVVYYTGKNNFENPSLVMRFHLSSIVMLQQILVED